jgi:hypothetical protein
MVGDPGRPGEKVKKNVKKLNLNALKYNSKLF